jgi:hypothetical protein
MRWRRWFVWICLVTAALVSVGVLLQAFSIAAYMRGAGADALDMHKTIGFLTHSVEIVVGLAALVAYWGLWRRVGLAILLPVIGTVQLLAVGDTERSGGWVNGLHGLVRSSSCSSHWRWPGTGNGRSRRRRRRPGAR